MKVEWTRIEDDQYALEAGNRPAMPPPSISQPIQPILQDIARADSNPPPSITGPLSSTANNESSLCQHARDSHRENCVRTDSSLMCEKDGKARACAFRNLLGQLWAETSCRSFCSARPRTIKIANRRNYCNIESKNLGMEVRATILKFILSSRLIVRPD